MKAINLLQTKNIIRKNFKIDLVLNYDEVILILNSISIFKKNNSFNTVEVIEIINNIIKEIIIHNEIESLFKLKQIVTLLNESFGFSSQIANFINASIYEYFEINTLEQIESSELKSLIDLLEIISKDQTIMNQRTILNIISKLIYFDKNAEYLNSTRLQNLYQLIQASDNQDLKKLFHRRIQIMKTLQIV